MKTKTMKLSLMAVATLLSACATTNIQSFKDPEFANKKYHSLVVISLFSDLKYRKSLGEKIVNSLKAKGINASMAINVFPPTRKYDTEAFANRFRESGSDAALIVSLKSSSSTQAYIPQTSSTSGNVNVYGNTAYYNSNTYTYGGFNVSKPIHNYELKLIDGKSDETVWIASSTTGGNAYATIETMFDSLANEISKKLETDGLLSIPKHSLKK